MPVKITLEFPDGSKKEFQKGITARKIAEGIGQRQVVGRTGRVVRVMLPVVFIMAIAAGAGGAVEKLG